MSFCWDGVPWIAAFHLYHDRVRAPTHQAIGRLEHFEWRCSRWVSAHRLTITPCVLLPEGHTWRGGARGYHPVLDLVLGPSRRRSIHIERSPSGRHRRQPHLDSFLDLEMRAIPNPIANSRAAEPPRDKHGYGFRVVRIRV